MNHAQFIQELFQEGDAWRITVRFLDNVQLLWREIFPNTVPYGITIAEDVIITEPEVSGSFLIRGLTSDSLQYMDPEYAQKFSEAGLAPFHSHWSLEGSPEPGKVRTWFQGADTPTDLYEDEAAELYADNWMDVELPADLTVWDPISAKTVTFKYRNGMTYPIPLSAIVADQYPAERLLNHHNYLIIPADDSLNPILSARTVPNMLALRLVLEEKDREVKEQQLEIGYMIHIFTQAIRDLANGGTWQDPVQVFRSGLGQR